MMNNVLGGGPPGVCVCNQNDILHCLLTEVRVEPIQSTYHRITYQRVRFSCVFLPVRVPKFDPINN